MAHCAASGILVSWRDGTHAPCSGSMESYHWTAREAPRLKKKKKIPGENIKGKYAKLGGRKGKAIWYWAKMRAVWIYIFLKACFLALSTEKSPETMVAHEQKSNQSPGLTYNHHPPVKETRALWSSRWSQGWDRMKAPGGARKIRKSSKGKGNVSKRHGSRLEKGVC